MLVNGLLDGINPTYVGIGESVIGGCWWRWNQPHVCGDRF